MKKSFVILLCFTTLSPLPVFADTVSSVKPASWTDNISGSLDLTTNYMFRGLSQTDDKPAVQGGLLYTFPVGMYVGTWGSNVNFTTFDGQSATSELDVVTGIRNTLYRDFTYDVSLNRYSYPGATTASYNELNTILCYKFLHLSIGYTGNYFGSHVSGLYTNGTLSYDIPAKYTLNIQDVSVSAGMGHYRLAKKAGNSYSDYSFMLNKKINSIYTITGQWTNTNGGAKLSPTDGNQLLATLTALF